MKSLATTFTDSAVWRQHVLRVHSLLGADGDEELLAKSDVLSTWRSPGAGVSLVSPRFVQEWRPLLNALGEDHSTRVASSKRRTSRARGSTTGSANSAG